MSWAGQSPLGVARTARCRHRAWGCDQATYLQGELRELAARGAQVKLDDAFVNLVDTGLAQKITFVQATEDLYARPVRW